MTSTWLPVLARALVGAVALFQACAVLVLISFNRARRRFDIEHPLTLPAPPISILVPIKGPARQIDQTVGALIEQDYPGGLELVLAFQDADDPSLPDAEAIAAGASGRTEVRILRGLAFLGLNPKNSNLAHALRAATHSWVFVCDVDTRLPRSFLRRAMATTGGSENRYVTGITVHEGARTLGALLETIGTNLAVVTYFLLSYRNPNGPGPINGAANLFHRSLLERCGGIGITLNALTEDAVLEKAFNRSGGQGRLAPDWVRVRQESQSLSGFFSRFKRWMMIARCYVPLSVISPAFWIGQWLLALGLLSGSQVTLACGLAVLLIRMAASFCFQILLGTPAEDWPKAAILPLSDLLVPLLWLASRLSREVSWGGRRLIVRRDGMLVAAPDPALTS